MHCDWANIHKSVIGRKVLVVGCNTGLDCRTFIELGAGSVDGLDIDSNIGSDFSHEKVHFELALRACPLEMKFII